MFECDESLFRLSENQPFDMFLDIYFPSLEEFSAIHLSKTADLTLCLQHPAQKMLC